MKQRICIVASSVMTVNAFLLEPLKKLSINYDVYLVVNGRSEDISTDLDNVNILSVAIERKISPFRDLMALFKLIKIFRQYNFRAVHSVTPKAGLLAMAASFFSGVQTRIHIFTGQVWATRNGFSRRFLKLMDHTISWFATDVLADSGSQRQFLLDENVVSSNKSSVLANGSISGVDTTRFKLDKKSRLRIRKEFAIKNSDTVFLFIGRLNRDKGVIELAISFLQISTENTHLFIVGPDEVGIRSEMESLLKNCLDRVHFVGFSTHPEEYMSASDCLCLPSYREGFGTVVIEAAAVGIPAIGSNIYGIKDAISEGESGLLFEAGSVDELKASMITIMSDKVLYKKIKDGAKKRVLEQFTSEILATAWLRYYQERL